MWVQGALFAGVRRLWLSEGVGPNDTMCALSQDAQRLSLMLQYGVLSGADVVRWADSQIVAQDSPSDALIELATTPTSQIADQLSHLRALASGADFWEAFRVLLGALHAHLTVHPERAEDIASELSRTVLWSDPGDVPGDLGFIYHFDDAFSHAREGIYGEPEAVLHEFRCELEKFKGEVQPDASPNGGPTTGSGNSGLGGGPPSVS